jgi:hypothetical protein
LLKKIERAITNILDYQRPEHARVSSVTGIDPRTRYSIRAALSEVGYPAPVARRPQPLLYRELNRRGERVWRAA